MASRMTPQELRAWITGRSLTIKAAAKMLGLSEDGLAHQLNGRRPVSEQTRQLCHLWDAYDGIGGGDSSIRNPDYQKAKPTEEPR